LGQGQRDEDTGWPSAQHKQGLFLGSEHRRDTQRFTALFALSILPVCRTKRTHLHKRRASTAVLPVDHWMGRRSPPLLVRKQTIPTERRPPVGVTIVKCSNQDQNLLVRSSNCVTAYFDFRHTAPTVSLVCIYHQYAYNIHIHIY
jgi:hypothetical protein